MKQTLNCLIGLFLTVASGTAFAQSTIIKTSDGYIRGIKEENSLVFKGIPYAKPPIGELRFKAPQPVQRWKDTLVCEQFSSPSAQYSGTAKGLRGDENSLYLNVYTPSVSAKHAMPVVVWVHGGSLTTGSGMGMNGHAFADQDSIICVTINYRLGVFGFLYLGDVAPVYRTSSNNGLLDLVQALKWIKYNIKAFGGDPDRVTVMGESAGAKLSSTLLATDKSDGLYKQLVLESGGVQCIRDSITAKAIRQRLMAVLHLQKPSEILSLPAAELINAQNEILNGAAGTNYFGPVQDGVVITEDPYKYLRKHTSDKIRFLIGSNKRESKLFMDMDKRLYQPDTKVLQDWYGENYPLVLSTYHKEAEKLGTDSAAVTVLTQYMYQMHTYRLAETLADAGKQVWMYRFDYNKDGKGATHAEELAYVWYVPGKHSDSFNNPLAVQMHHNWVNFIKGEQPAVNWTRYQTQKKTVMIFDHQPAITDLTQVYNDVQYPSAGFILK